MTARPVEWVLVIFYGVSAHRATYGRLSGNEYTKDYIQLSRKSKFVGDLSMVFPGLASGAGAVAVTYAWSSGMAQGELVSPFSGPAAPQVEHKSRSVGVENVDAS